MPNQVSSWNGTLPSDVLLDSGVLLIGAAIFAAQDGGLKYDPGRSIRQVTFDGQRANIVGLDRVVGRISKFSATVKQMPSTAYASFEPGATTVTVSGGPSGATQMQGKAANILYATGDYLSNLRGVWLRGDNSLFQIRMPKALCVKWDLTGKDKEEALYAVEFESRLDMSVSGQLVSNQPDVAEWYPAGP